MYHYKGTGLDNVYLSNGYRQVDYGNETATAVMNVEGLHKAIAKALIYKSSKLNGKEIRFLRTEIDMPQTGLAELLGVDVQTVANWEKGVHEINGAAERLLRLFAGERILNSRGRISAKLKEYAEITNHMEERLCFHESKEGWSKAA